MAGVHEMQAFLQGRGYVAQYRIGRSPGRVLEAHLDQLMGLAFASKSGGGPSNPQFSSEWWEVRRGFLVRLVGSK